MRKGFKRLVAAVLLFLLVGFMPTVGAFAETAAESSTTAEVSTENEQEVIEEEEVPLAQPAVNTVMFMWCGIAMVIVLAAVTAYASFGKTETKRVN